MGLGLIRLVCRRAVRTKQEGKRELARLRQTLSAARVEYQEIYRSRPANQRGSSVPESRRDADAGRARCEIWTPRSAGCSSCAWRRPDSLAVPSQHDIRCLANSHPPPTGKQSGCRPLRHLTCTCASSSKLFMFDVHKVPEMFEQASVGGSEMTQDAGLVRALRSR